MRLASHLHSHDTTKDLETAPSKIILKSFGPINRPLVPAASASSLYSGPQAAASQASGSDPSVSGGEPSSSEPELTRTAGAASSWPAATSESGANARGACGWGSRSGRGCLEPCDGVPLHAGVAPLYALSLAIL